MSGVLLKHTDKEVTAMAMIAQPPLFNWDQIDHQDDLQRLRYVLEALPDESLIKHLERRRGRGRDDYPILAMWNATLAGIVFQHVSIESLRRELQRNALLRQLCGFHPLGSSACVPTAWAFSRFLGLLMDCQEQIDGMFNDLVERLRERLADLGAHLAGDGKAIPSHARPRAKDAPVPEQDGRRDVDADFGFKTTRGKRKDGTTWEKVTKWFGYKLHLLVDTNYELPVAFRLTEASASEVVQMRDQLLVQLEQDHPQVLERCEAAMFDKGYDDSALTTQLHEDHDIAPIIAIRDCWQDGKRTRAVPELEGVYYDYQGNIECRSSCDGQNYRMAYGGYEKDRQTQKFRCPARHYGQACASLSTCPIGSGSGQVRVPLTIDRRIFTPVARPSYRWKDLYDERSAVERVNGRIDQNLGFERHYIRGRKKMTMRVSLALIVMLAMALGRIMHGQADELRSLVRPAA